MGDGGVFTPLMLINYSEYSLLTPDWELAMCFNQCHSDVIFSFLTDLYLVGQCCLTMTMLENFMCEGKPSTQIHYHWHKFKFYYYYHNKRFLRRALTFKTKHHFVKAFICIENQYDENEVMDDLGPFILHWDIMWHIIVVINSYEEFTLPVTQTHLLNEICRHWNIINAYFTIHTTII